MNKNVMIIGGVIAVVVLGAAAFFLMTSNKAKFPATSTTATEQSTQSQDGSTKGTIKSLLAKGGNATCTISYPTAEGETKGTVYISGQKVRSDMTITSAKDNKPMESHMIVDNGTGYFWSSLAAKGTKMKIDVNEAASASPTSSQTDLDQQVEYKCSSGNVDASKFTLPTGIDFLDAGAFAPIQSGSGVPGSKAICDAITEADAKAACLSTIK